MNNDNTNVCTTAAICSALEAAKQAHEQLSGILEYHGTEASRQLCRLLTDLRDEKMNQVVRHLETAATACAKNDSSPA